MGKVEESEKNECEDEAIRLALKYNFVTDLSSLVIEENDDYIKKGPVSIGEKKPETSYPGLRSQVAYSSFAYASGGPRVTSLSGGTRFKSAPGRPVLLSARLPSASSGPRGGPRRRKRPQRPSPSKFGGSRTTTPAYTSTTTT